MTRASIANFSARWLSELAAATGPIPPDRLDLVRLPALCANSTLQVEISSACGDLHLSTALDLLAVITLVVSIGLLVILVGARLAAPRLGRRLGLAFKPALLALLVGLFVLVVAGSIVIVGGTYTTEQSSTGAFHPYFVVIGATTGVALILGSIRALGAFRDRPPFSVNALPVDRASEPRLFELIDRLAGTMGTESPANVLVGLVPTFFVTELPVRAFDLALDGRTLYLSLPLCRILEPDELEAVLAHELAHYHGGDTELSQQFYPIYVGSRSAFAAYLSSQGGFAAIAALLPANVLALFFSSFALAERRMSRMRELAADQLAAKQVSPAALGSALLKLDWHGPTWSVVLVEGIRKIRWHFSPGNLSAEFAALAKPKPPLAGEGRPDVTVNEHPTDTHPPVAVRLEKLGGAGPSEARARTLPALNPSIQVFTSPEALELQLIQRMQTGVAAELKVEPTASPDSPAAPTAAVLRSEGASDAFVAAVVDLVEDRWGRDLVRPYKPRGHWIALADLAITPDGEPPNKILVPGIARPPGTPVRVTGLADRGAEGDLIIPADARLIPFGYNRDQRNWPEDLYLLDDRMVIVSGVGVGPLEEQLAGLFLVPTEDSLVEHLPKVLDLIGRRPASPRPAARIARSTRRRPAPGP